MITSKFNNFGPIYVINLKERLNRKKYIKNHFKKYGITNYKFFEAYNAKNLEGKFKMNAGNIGCTMSHLLAIKDWYETSNEEYVIISEDDISFENSKYWTWTWEELIQSINFKFDIIHMSTCTFHIHVPEQLSAEKRSADNTGLLTTCYLISRNGAKQVLEKTIGLDGTNKLDFNDENNIADHGIIYGNVKNYYILPLFTQTNKFESDVASVPVDHVRFHQMNYEHTAWLWKYNNRTIKEILYSSE